MIATSFGRVSLGRNRMHERRRRGAGRLLASRLIGLRTPEEQKPVALGQDDSLDELETGLATERS